MKIVGAKHASPAPTLNGKRSRAAFSFQARSQSEYASKYQKSERRGFGRRRSSQHAVYVGAIGIESDQVTVVINAVNKGAADLKSRCERLVRIIHCLPGVRQRVVDQPVVSVGVHKSSHHQAVVVQAEKAGVRAIAAWIVKAFESSVFVYESVRV